MVNFPTTVRGCLLGGAFGDAFGYRVKHRMKLWPSQPGVRPASAAGTEPIYFSAHTQLTLFTVDGLVEALDWANQGIAADPIACLWLSYLRWLRTQQETIPPHSPAPPKRWLDQQPALLIRRSPPASCLEALLSGEMGTPAKPLNTAAEDPAAVLRAAPFGLIPYLEPDTVAKMSLDGAALTHGHPVALWASAAFSRLIHQLSIQGLSLDAAVESMLGYLRRSGAPVELIDRLVDAGLETKAGMADVGRETSAGLETKAGMEAKAEPGASVAPGSAAQDQDTAFTAADALALALGAVLSTTPADPGAPGSAATNPGSAATNSGSNAINPGLAATDPGSVTVNRPREHFLAALSVAAGQLADPATVCSMAGSILGALYGEDCLPSAVSEQPRPEIPAANKTDASIPNGPIPEGSADALLLAAEDRNVVLAMASALLAVTDPVDSSDG